MAQREAWGTIHDTGHGGVGNAWDIAIGYGHVVCMVMGRVNKRMGCKGKEKHCTLTLSKPYKIERVGEYDREGNSDPRDESKTIRRCVIVEDKALRSMGAVGLRWG